MDETSTKDRLLQTGAELFAEKGFAGVSVRQICAAAGTSMNMIHHYFGNKEGLLTAIADRFSARIFVVPMRLLENVPPSQEKFLSLMELLFETTLEAYVEEEALVRVAIREQLDAKGITEFSQKFVAFLDQAKKQGFVRQELDSEMITGAMLDRILNQVQFAPWLARVHGVDVLTDIEYRQRWCKSNLDLYLYGLVDSGITESQKDRSQ